MPLPENRLRNVRWAEKHLTTGLSHPMLFYFVLNLYSSGPCAKSWFREGKNSCVSALNSKVIKLFLSIEHISCKVIDSQVI